MAGETIECTLCEHSIVMNKKECALAHSRAEARLLRQPSTLAPSAHPRGAFLSYRNEVSYTIKKNPAKQDSPPAAGRASDILPFRCSAIRAERFLSYGNEVSYTRKKPPRDT